MSKPSFLTAIRIPVLFVAIIWIVHLLQISILGDLGGYGIYPRTTFGFRGVFLAPLIHGDFGHLINNSIPLFAMTALIIFFYPRVAFRSMTMIYILTGIAVWLMGRTVFHIGASGVVYGLVSFVFWTGIFRRNLKAIVLGLIVLVYYSGMFLGILPNQEGISWESHLMGALVGVFVAYWYREEIEGDEERKKYSWELENDNHEPRSFLDEDTFEKTKLQRESEKDQFGGDWFSSDTR